MASNKAKATIKRTNDVMKAQLELEQFKQQITDVQDALEKKSFSKIDTCQVIVAIGQKIQGISKIIRPHTREGYKTIRRNMLQVKWRSHINKNIEDHPWILKNCTLFEGNEPGHGQICHTLVDGEIPSEWRKNPPPSRFSRQIERQHLAVKPSKFWIKSNPHDPS